MNHLDERINAQINRVLETAKSIIGPSMRGAYLFGSAVTGGLKKDSDIDILIINEGDIADFGKAQLIEAFMQISGKIGNQENKRYLEITILNEADISPLRYPPRQDLLYGEWLREEFEEGNVPEKENNPDLVLILKQILENHHILYGERPEKIIPEISHDDIQRAIRDTLPELVNDYAGDERNVILTLCRMIVIVETGNILSKDRAAEAVLTMIPNEYQDLFENTYLGYLGEYDDRDSYQDESEVKGLIDYLKGALGKLLVEGNQL